MNELLYEIARAACEDMTNLSFFVASGSTDMDEVEDALFKIRRGLEKACDEHMQQGDRIALTSSYKLECAECGIDIPDSDVMYLHLRKDHGMVEDEAAMASHEGKGKYDEEIATLRELLPKHTGVMIEDDDPFKET